MGSPRKYKVVISDKAKKQLHKLDRQKFNVITAWIKKNLVDCENPRNKGKGLVGNHRREWRYRVGDYRIIADIDDNTITILIVGIGHRREIYD
mgnify:CR=1 FL=1